MPAVLTIFGFCICSFTSACLGRQRRALVLYLVAVLLGLPVAVGCAVAGWSGAEKLSRYFGQLLTERHGLNSQKSDADIAAVWGEKSAAYEAEKANAASPY